jgi:hypothetical protein
MSKQEGKVFIGGLSWETTGALNSLEEQDACLNLKTQQFVLW